ncbi:MAG TPA: hypothetical protein VK993_08055 [Chthoniobacterales bacterium]|nr:hypothetical protein [Chthoniobacterales bacterium]
MSLRRDVLLHVTVNGVGFSANPQQTNDAADEDRPAHAHPAVRLARPPSGFRCGGFARKMKMVTDCFGRPVRLTDQRLAHILEHAEMRDMDEEIVRTLRFRTEVRVSSTDAAVRLFYEFYFRTAVGDKWLCVVVKYLSTMHLSLPHI